MACKWLAGKHCKEDVMNGQSVHKNMHQNFITDTKLSVCGATAARLFKTWGGQGSCDIILLKSPLFFFLSLASFYSLKKKKRAFSLKFTSLPGHCKFSFSNWNNQIRKSLLPT